MALFRIRNINALYGGPNVFVGPTVEAAVNSMLRELHTCDADFLRIDALIEGIDFEVLGVRAARRRRFKSY